MSSPSRIIEWTALMSTHLPALSQPQATVLALWSLGLVRARLGLDGGGSVPRHVVATPGADCSATGARVVL